MLDRYPEVQRTEAGLKWFNCPCCGAKNTLGGYVAAHTNEKLHGDCQGKCGARFSVLRWEVVLEREAPEKVEPKTNARYIHKDML